MKATLSLVASFLIFTGVWELGGVARWLLNYPSDFAVLTSFIVLFLGLVIGYKLLRVVVYWGIVPLLKELLDEADQ